MQVMNIVKAMCGGALGGVIVKAFVDAANYSGTAATIAGLFTFVLLAAVALYALGEFR